MAISLSERLLHRLLIATYGSRVELGEVVGRHSLGVVLVGTPSVALDSPLFLNRILSKIHRNRTRLLPTKLVTPFALMTRLDVVSVEIVIV